MAWPMRPMPTMPTVRSRKRRRAQRILPLQPFAGAQKAFGLRKLAHGAQQQAERGVGDLLVEHVRRVGDDDAVLGRLLDVDVVVADAEARNELELRKPRHQVAHHLVGRAGHRGAAHVRRRALAMIASASCPSAITCRLNGPLSPSTMTLLRHSDQHHIGLVRPSLLSSTLPRFRASEPACWDYKTRMPRHKARMTRQRARHCGVAQRPC